MTEQPDLHFCSSNRSRALGLHQAYVRGVQSKVFPAFDNIDIEAEAFAEQEYERLGNLPGWEDGPDMSDAAELATERGIELHDDLIFVKGQLSALAVAGLFHLWERTLKSFLKRTLGWEGITDSGRKRLLRASFEELIEYLKDLGFSITGQPYFENLDVARLIANTCKHGDGTAFRTLLQKYPDLFRGPYDTEPSLNTTEPEDLWISPDKFSELAKSFSEFWEQMPEYLPIPAAWTSQIS